MPSRRQGRPAWLTLEKERIVMIRTEKIAVVILNWNGCDMMRRFLPGVARGSEGDGLVIVADNGSTDRSLAMLEKEFPSVARLPLSENYGFAGGYNRALAEIDAPYYLLLNSDVEVPEGWLRPLLAFMESHRDVAACQPKLLSERERGKFEYAGAAGGFIDRLGYPFCRGRIFGEVEEDNGQYEGELPALWASGAALMIRKADWDMSGGLDERFFAHQEEIDLCWRLCARGRKVACVTASHVWHVGGASLAAGNPRKTFLNFRNNLLMLFKNLPDDELRGVMRWRTVLDWVAACKFLLAGDVANFRAVLRARREFRKLRPQFLADRKRNLSLSANGGKSLQGRISQSLLFLYYIKGVRRFSQIPLSQ